jgi:hypothetical protein
MGKHVVDCVDNTIKYAYDVKVDNQVVAEYLYHSWIRGGGYTAAKASASELAINLRNILDKDGPYNIKVINDGISYNVSINDVDMTKFPYVSALIPFGTNSTTAMASANDLALKLSKAIDSPVQLSSLV